MYTAPNTVVAVSDVRTRTKNTCHTSDAAISAVTTAVSPAMPQSAAKIGIATAAATPKLSLGSRASRRESA